MLDREISALSSIVVSDSTIFQKSIVDGVLLAASLDNCIGCFFVEIFGGGVYLELLSLNTGTFFLKAFQFLGSGYEKYFQGVKRRNLLSGL